MAFRPGRHFRLLRHREPAPVGVSHTVQVESSLLHCSGIDELSNEGAKLYERQRRVILSAGMMAVHGRIQREGEVVHLVAHRVSDLSEFLASVGSRDTTFPMPHGRGDEVHGNPVLDPCIPPPEVLVQTAKGRHTWREHSFGGREPEC